MAAARQVDFRAAVVSGLVAGTVYALTAEVDNRISGRNLDDLKLLGRPAVRNAKWAKLAGVPIHLFNSVVLAVAFAAVRHRLPGGPAARGIAFATIENTLLYPIAALDGHHPGVRDGQADRYFTLPAYLLSIPRHTAYGATLGLLYERLRRRQDIGPRQ